MLNGREVADLDEDARVAVRSREIGFVFQMSSLLGAIQRRGECGIAAGLCRSQTG